MQERNYEIPELHDYKEYAYKEERLIGLKNWYKDYMTCNIKTSEGKTVGLNEVVYTLTPPAESDFRYSTEVEFNEEPDNLIEEVRNIFDVIFRMFGIE